MAVYVCPYCCHELQKKKAGELECPQCHEVINVQKWKDILGKDFDKVFSLTASRLTPQLELREDGKKVSRDKTTIVIPQDLISSVESNIARVRKASGEWKLEKTATHPVFILEETGTRLVYILEKTGTHPVYINDNEVSSPVELRDGDVIKINGIEFYTGGELKSKDLILTVDINYGISSSDYRSCNCSVTIKPDIACKDDVKNQSSFPILKEYTRINLIGSNLPDSAADVTPQALLYKKDNSWWICDLTEGAYTLLVNGNITHNKELFWGDTITIGNQNYKYDIYKLIKQEKPEASFSLVVENLNVNKAKGISFRAVPKDFIGLLGPSGSGKTTIIHQLVGLTEYDAGSINGIEGRSALPRCSYMHQHPALHDNLTVMQECECFARLYTKIPQNEIKDYTNAVLQLVGLSDCKKQQVHTLSGGEQKRLCIAMELLRDPKILILDEPTSGLDPANEKEIMKYLRRISEQKKIVICSTHMMENIDKFTKVILLNKSGNIDCFASPDQARKQYGVDNFSDIYEKLQNIQNNEENNQNNTAAKKQDAPTNNSHRGAPKQQNPNNETLPGWRRQFGAYFKRDIYQLFSFLYFEKWNSPLDFLKKLGNWTWNFIFSAFSFQLLFQPLLIAWFISLTCYAKFFGSSPDHDNAGIFFFLCLISVFWLGMNNSIQELASERIPGRCLENLNKISIFVYIPEKMVWTAVLSFFQTLIFCLCLYLCVPHAVPDEVVGTATPYLVINLDLSWTTLWIFGILFSMCVLGAWTALAVSATFCETVALSVMPLILIPILLFSYAVINEDKLCTMGLNIESCSPCEEPLALIELLNESHFNAKTQNPKPEDETSQQTPNSGEKNSSSPSPLNYDLSPEIRKYCTTFFYRQAIWFLAVVGLIFLAQSINEESWKGR